MINYSRLVRAGKSNGRDSGILTSNVAYAYIAPFVLMHLLLTLLPTVYSIALSFFQYRGYGKAIFVGLKNYINLFQMTSMWRQLGNTLFYYIAHLIPCLVFGFLLAFAVHSRLNTRTQRVFKPIFYLPQMCSIVASSMIFSIVFGTNVGVVNQILGTKIPFLTNVSFIKIPVLTAIIWRTMGWYFLILLAGMTTVSKDHVEAAVVDGATTWQQMKYVIIPIMKPIFSFLIITETMSSLKIYTEPALITKQLGGSVIPIAASPMVNVVITNLEGGQFGIASAAGWILFIVILIFTLIYMRVFNENLS